MSELEVDISKRDEVATSSNNASSKFQALQKHSTMSPYFIAQSIAYPKSRAISSTTSNNNIEIKDNTRSAAASSSTISTTSFCDISNLQDAHTTNEVGEETVPASFYSNGLKRKKKPPSDTTGIGASKFSSQKSQQRMDHKNKNSQIVRPVNPPNTLLENCKRKEIDKVTCNPKFDEKHSDSSDLSRNQSNSSSSLRSSSRAISPNTLSDQKVKRMYL